jgi:hypothetical protein
MKRDKVIEEAKKFVWLINSRNGGANEIDIFTLIDLYLKMFGDDYSKRFNTPEDEFKWLYNQVVKGIEISKEDLPINGSKVCAGCKEDKSLSQFHRNKKSTDGRKARCKPCSRDYQNQYNKNNPDKVAAYKETSVLRKKKKKYEL